MVICVYASVRKVHDRLVHLESVAARDSGQLRLLQRPSRSNRTAAGQGANPVANRHLQRQGHLATVGATLTVAISGYWSSSSFGVLDGRGLYVV